MKTIIRLLLTLVLVAAGCAGGYQLWDYYMLSPWGAATCVSVLTLFVGALHD